MKINCPACGAEGEIAPINENVFTPRGQYQGKTVIKCKKCETGLLVGMSNIFFRRPKIINPELWGKMQERWSVSAQLNSPPCAHLNSPFHSQRLAHNA